MFEADLANDIIRVFEVADKDDHVRAVVLSADPTAPAYCSGVSPDDPFEQVRKTQHPSYVQANITGGWDNLLTTEEKKEGLHCKYFGVTLGRLAYDVLVPQRTAMAEGRSPWQSTTAAS